MGRRECGGHPGPDVLAVKRNWRAEPLDFAVAPLVAAINRWPGLKTVASCQGHEWSGTPPYVSVLGTPRWNSPATLESLAVIVARLTDRWTGRPAALHYPWTVTLHGHPEAECSWMLHPMNPDRVRWWEYRGLRNDLHRLAALLSHQDDRDCKDEQHHQQQEVPVSSQERTERA